MFFYAEQGCHLAKPLLAVRFYSFDSLVSFLYFCKLIKHYYNMSDQPLVPFKAYFEFQYNNNLNEIYPEHLETFLQRSSDDGQTVKTATFLKNYLTGAKLPIFLKDRKVDFDYHTRHSIYPESFSVTNLNQAVEFKIKSDEVTVIQILKDDITFKTASGEIKTETLTDQIKLFSL